MDSNNTSTNHATSVLDNVINKLQIYMEQNEQTLYGLASKMGFAYQPFYRLITKKHMPTIDSLAMIAEHFNCTVSELIHDNVFVNIDLFDSIANFIKSSSIAKIRIYIPYGQFLPLIHNQFFAIKVSAKEQLVIHSQNNGIDSNLPQVGVFYKVDNIDIDGLFLVAYNNKNILLNILSISSKYVIAEINGKEVKIDKEAINPKAKFLNYLNILNANETILTGVIQ